MMMTTMPEIYSDSLMEAQEIFFPRDTAMRSMRG